MPAITVPFHGDRLLGVQNEQGEFVYLKPIVERLGLDWSSQHKRLKRDPILREGMVVMTIPREFGDAQEAVFLRLDLFHGWLFKVSISRVDAAHRERLTVYQREAYAVLHAAFTGTLRPVARKAFSPAESNAVHRHIREVRLMFGILAGQKAYYASGLPIYEGMRPPEQPDLLDRADGSQH